MRKKKIDESQLLIPKSYREKQAKAARKKHTKTVIRVQFPDGIVLQAIFLPSEPTTALYEVSPFNFLVVPEFFYAMNRNKNMSCSVSHFLQFSY